MVVAAGPALPSRRFAVAGSLAVMIGMVAGPIDPVRMAAGVSGGLLCSSHDAICFRRCRWLCQTPGRHPSGAARLRAANGAARDATVPECDLKGLVEIS